MSMKRLMGIGLVAALGALPGLAQYKAVNPKVAKVVGEVSEQRIEAILKKLESFGTRQLSSRQDDPSFGVGAARKWIFEQFRSFSPRLEVAYDQYRVKRIETANSRVLNDVDLYNVIAVLPGKTHPDRRVVVTAHYDTLQLATRTGSSVVEGQAVMNQDMNAPAPGVTDDGSGVACVMELARILSQYEFDKTLVFVAFSGEEEGLLGSTLYAAKVKAQGQTIEALLNNDIIGSAVSDSGRSDTRRVNVYSADPSDSGPRTVARYVRDMAERYVPSMTASLVFREDRVGRGGDQIPFVHEGYSAVRLTTPTENYAHEHTATDTFEFASVPYIARVTKINIATAASLAWAPLAPVATEETQVNGKATQVAMLNRGASLSDAYLRWTHTPEASLAGYVIVDRATTSPVWEKEWFVREGKEFTIPDVNIDELVFGVKAVDKDGNESLVAPYIPTSREKRVVATY